jgi:serralysin
MALNDFFSHDGSDQSTMESRALAAGYSYSLLAENIQAGARSPQEVVNDPIMGWMQSPSHRANILNCNLHEIGIGYYYQADDQVIPGVGGPFLYYWTVDFGTPLP